MGCGTSTSTTETKETSKVKTSDQHKGSTPRVNLGDGGAKATRRVSATKTPVAKAKGIIIYNSS